MTTVAAGAAMSRRHASNARLPWPPASDVPERPASEAVLTGGEAGHRAIRGGMIRVGGYGAGLVFAAAAAGLLTRHLGLEDFGRYVVVIALISIVQGISDAGLTIAGQRRYVVCETAAERRVLLGDMLGLRMALTVV